MRTFWMYASAIGLAVVGTVTSCSDSESASGDKDEGGAGGTSGSGGSGKGGASGSAGNGAAGEATGGTSTGGASGTAGSSGEAGADPGGSGGTGGGNDFCGANDPETLGLTDTDTWTEFGVGATATATSIPTGARVHQARLVIGDDCRVFAFVENDGDWTMHTAVAGGQFQQTSTNSANGTFDTIEPISRVGDRFLLHVPMAEAWRQLVTIPVDGGAFAPVQVEGMSGPATEQIENHAIIGDYIYFTANGRSGLAGLWRAPLSDLDDGGPLVPETGYGNIAGLVRFGSRLVGTPMVFGGQTSHFDPEDCTGSTNPVTCTFTPMPMPAYGMNGGDFIIGYGDPINLLAPGDTDWRLVDHDLMGGRQGAQALAGEKALLVNYDDTTNYSPNGIIVSDLLGTPAIEPLPTAGLWTTASYTAESIKLATNGTVAVAFVVTGTGRRVSAIRLP